MTEFRELLGKIYDKSDLTLVESRQAALAMVQGSWEAAQISAFLVGLHMKGESAEELAGFALAMQEKALTVPLDDKPTMDTCGTGGDQKGSFNISTLAAFVLAGCGIPVAKHGNRAASSACGSADLLEALGIRFRLLPEEIPLALERARFAFLFAPDYHPATRSVVAIRKQLGIPTIFNLLGPLTNPARPSAQLIGVYDSRAVPLMGQAIRKIEPSKRAILLHGVDGWDEATPCCDFWLYPVSGESSLANVRDFGLEACKAEDLKGGSPSENAKIAMSILKGQKSPKQQAVLLNAMLGYMVFHSQSSSFEALRAVRESLHSGAAMEVVNKFKQTFPLESA